MAERTVKEWLDELDAALDYREQYARESAWSTIDDCFYNAPNSFSAVGPNIIYSEGDTLISSLTVPDPEFLVDPEDELSALTAPVVEQLANRLAAPHRVSPKRHVEDALLFGYLYGNAILKIGYDSEFGWNPNFDLGTVQKPLGLTKTQFSKSGNRLEFRNIVPGMPWMRAVSPHDFLVPWGSGANIDDVPWCAFRFIRRNDLLKADPKYKTSRLEPQMSMDDFMESYQSGAKKVYRTRSHRLSSYAGRNAPIFNELWEIVDREHQKVYVVCYTHDSFLRNEPDYLQMALGSAPYVSASFVRSPRCFWAPSLAYMLGQHQKDSHDIFKQATKQRRINVAKFILQGGLLSPEEEDKLISGDVGAFAKTANSQKPKDAFVAFPKSQNFDLYADAEILQRCLRGVMGYSKNQSGEYDSSSRRTAYEASRVYAGALTRQASKEDAAKHLYNESMRKMLNLVFRYWTAPRTLLLNNEWVKFTGQQLSGRYGFRTHLATRSNMSKPERLMQALQMMGYFAQFPNIDLARIEKYIMDAANDPQFTGFFQMQNQPQLSQPALVEGSQPASPEEGRPKIATGYRNNFMRSGDDANL